MKEKERVGLVLSNKIARESRFFEFLRDNKKNMGITYKESILRLFEKFVLGEDLPLSSPVENSIKKSKSEESNEVFKNTPSDSDYDDL